MSSQPADRGAPAIQDRSRTLYRNGIVYSQTDPFATALLVEGGIIAWLGSDAAAEVHRDAHTEVVDLDGALLAPAFVDAHIHATATGIGSIGLDLTATTSLSQVLDMVTEAVRSGPGGTILGYGWDEQVWPEQRAPTRAELDRAGYGAAILLDRIDVHSSVVSSALLAAMPGLAELAGFDPDGWLREHAHEQARAAVYADLPEAQRRGAQQAVLAEAARVGIGVVHEIGGPTISSAADMTGLLDLADQGLGPEVVGYWGELDGVRRAIDLRCSGVAGDLFVDGTVGSHTAALREDYADRPDRGHPYLTAAQVRDHVIDCAANRVQAGFHVIGDGALDLVLAGFTEAAERVGFDTIRTGSHRLEHVEFVHPEHIPVMAGMGLIASVQPMFDAEWGGPAAMYAERLGDRWRSMNPFASMQAGGVVLAFGSDSPVTALGPWAAVRAAAEHRTTEQRMSVRAAFAAHTRGGWRAAANRGGVLAPGEPAFLAVWDFEELVVAAPDDRVSAWSTDPRSATPGLPDLSPDRELPNCLRTVVRGRTVFDSGDL